jgi:hypothetical protein
LHADPARVIVPYQGKDHVVDDPNFAPDWTLIDGLQHTICYIIAVLIAAVGDELIEIGCIDDKCGTRLDVNELLKRQQQLEVFYKIDVAGVLHFMLLLNGAQRQMNAKIQLQLMACSRGACKPTFHCVGIDYSGLLKLKTALSEHGEVGNAAHVVL